MNSIAALTISIGKAFNSFEAPVKSKHGMFAKDISLIEITIYK